MKRTTNLGLELSECGPLAVCINDCQLDYGQPNSQLARICFQVGCAFAEMRWGISQEAAIKTILSDPEKANDLASLQPK